MNNDHLPMDVLEEIFYHYRVHEAIFYPLETLLLVCKFWSAAALSCPALWGDFKIYISHEPVISMWETRIPLRIARSGPSSPIDIRIDSRNELAQLPISGHSWKFSLPCIKQIYIKQIYNTAITSCFCHDKRQRFVATALELLAGKNGVRCERWRNLDLQLGGVKYRIDPLQSDDEGSFLRGLTYPTPALKMLRINNVKVCEPRLGSNYRMLPFTPGVEELEILFSSLPWHPSKSTARKIRIKARCRRYEPTYLEVPNIVEDLQIDIGGSGICLPSQLSHLTKLTIDGAFLPKQLAPCRMPRLQYFSVDIGYLFTAQRLVDEYPNFPFEQIRHLNFELHDSSNWACSLQQLQVSLLEILRRVATSLTSLRSVKAVQGIVLKWLWEYKRSMGNDGAFAQGVGLYFPNKVVLSTEDLEHELSGDEGCEDLERLAQEWSVMSPRNDWKVLISKLQYLRYVDSAKSDEPNDRLRT